MSDRELAEKVSSAAYRAAVNRGQTSSCSSAKTLTLVLRRINKTATGYGFTRTNLVGCATPVQIMQSIEALQTVGVIERVSAFFYRLLPVNRWKITT